MIFKTFNIKINESKKNVFVEINYILSYNVKYRILNVEVFFVQKTYNILDISKIIANITKELSILSSKLLKGKNNIHLYGKFLEENLEYIKWLNKEFNLRSSDTPPYVNKREIFYAELGINIGSEQRLRRPVVVLQNNAANAKGDTVIIAPITTYKRGDIVSDEHGELFIKSMKDGKEYLKKMGFYNILVKLEDGYKQEIVGFINIAHMREISKKRLTKYPIATITKDNFIEVQNAIIKNLDFDIDKHE